MLTKCLKAQCKRLEGGNVAELKFSRPINKNTALDVRCLKQLAVIKLILPHLLFLGVRYCNFLY